uniref:Uncharacterized protein n=1 Tax=Anguilla anguilla TaxID=7936 RepID=A0A0E9REH4_ANGAN
MWRRYWANSFSCLNSFSVFVFCSSCLGSLSGRHSNGSVK